MSGDEIFDWGRLPLAAVIIVRDVADLCRDSMANITMHSISYVSATSHAPSLMKFGAATPASLQAMLSQRRRHTALNLYADYLSQ